MILNVANQTPDQLATVANDFQRPPRSLESRLAQCGVVIQQDTWPVMCAITAWADSVAVAPLADTVIPRLVLLLLNLCLPYVILIGIQYNTKPSGTLQHSCATSFDNCTRQ